MTTSSIGRWCTIFKKSGASRRSVFVVKSQGGKMCRICGLRELLTFTIPAERFSFRYSMNFFCSASVCVCTSRSSVPHGSATIVQQVEGFSICSATLSSYKIELFKCRKNFFLPGFALDAFAGRFLTSPCDSEVVRYSYLQSLAVETPSEHQHFHE
jgi:hypothetical protein